MGHLLIGYRLPRLHVNQEHDDIRLANGDLGLRAVIQFSGNCLPEENIPAALTSLGFTRLNSRGWIDEDDMVPLKQVPPILLSEVLADYRTLADKTGGYVADWQKKIPW